MFVATSGEVLGVVSEFDKPIFDTIWLMSFDCDRWYVSLFTLSMLTPNNSVISTSSVIFNPGALMLATICLSYSSSGPSRIDSLMYSMCMIYPRYSTHSFPDPRLLSPRLPRPLPLPPPLPLTPQPARVCILLQVLSVLLALGCLWLTMLR